MPYDMIVSTVEHGVGNTLQTIALLIGLGSMFGAILQVSGGVETIAKTLLDKFGEDKAAWALGITGLVVGMPVFFESGLLILIPISFGLAKKTKKSILFYAIPLMAGLAVGHTFIPPTPGPVLVASMLNVELGYVIGIGIVVGAFVMVIAGIVFGKYIGNKIHVPVPKSYDVEDTHVNGKLPAFGTVVAIILLPLGLILLNTLSGAVPFLNPLQPLFSFLGTPFIALIISNLLAMFLLGKKHGYSKEELQKVMTEFLSSAGNIILLIAGGGVIRWMLQNSGLGVVVGDFVAQGSFPLVVVAFLIAAAVRVCIGSATVSMTMAAGIIAAMPETAALSQLHLAAITMAIASGATILSHVNDAGFWLVKSLFDIDEKTTFKSWTVMETIIGVIGLIGAIIVSMFA